jgi:hypothetical protein
MIHVYFSLIADKEELTTNKFTAVWTADGRNIFVPIIPIESESKEKIREELIRSIDSVLEHI